MRRFFCEQPIETSEVVLGDSEAHHIANVLRYRPGEQVTLFDGSGREYLAEILNVHRREVRLRIISVRAIDRELAFRLVLAVALPRGDRQDWLIQKAVELGVAELVPLKTERAVAIPSAKSQYRWRRTVVEAAKQSGRNRMMSIRSAIQFFEYLSEPFAGLRYIAQLEPQGRPLCELVQEASLTTDTSVCVAIGPEGGFSDDEQRRAQNCGWQPIDLGARTLRTETAAIAVAAYFSLLSGRCSSEG
jgi:16S rRNA (uracil1498-N3)-methyltransferase